MFIFWWELFWANFLATIRGSASAGFNEDNTAFLYSAAVDWGSIEGLNIFDGGDIFGIEGCHVFVVLHSANMKSIKYMYGSQSVQITVICPATDLKAPT